MVSRRIPLLLALLSFSIAGAASAVEHVVTVTDNPTELFDPQYVTIQAGDTVTWKNVAGTHNVVADDASFTSGDPTAAPWTYSHTFPAVGEFRYHCALHAADGQTGGIVVRSARAANEIAVTINAWDMERVTPIETGEVRTQEFMRVDGTFQSSVHLPSGVKITGIELSACDDTAVGGGSSALLYVCPEPQSPCALILEVDSTPSATFPFCRIFRSDVADGPIVDNLNNTYGLLAASNGTEGFRSVKVFYKKVLSPAPATATFADVPTTDLAFRAIEALAASGITSGCGPGQFCPTVTVTRAQMALFLARALGLFWPN